MILSDTNDLAPHLLCIYRGEGTPSTVCHQGLSDRIPREFGTITKISTFDESVNMGYHIGGKTYINL